MLELIVLASGSSGNAAIVRNADAERALLIDCGICKREFFARCNDAGFDPLEIEAVLVTHAHTDHTSGLGVVLRGLAKLDCRPPLYVHPATRLASQKVEDAGRTVALCDIVHGKPFEAAGITVVPFPTSHDSDGSTCFRFEVEDDALGYVTDTGFVTPEAHIGLQGARILAIESNHDVKMLMEGPYPYPLKQRILSSEGHLSNEQCCEEVASLLHPGLEHVIAMHVSEHNNTFTLPARELNETLAASGHAARIHVARPDIPIRL